MFVEHGGRTRCFDLAFQATWLCMFVREIIRLLIAWRWLLLALAIVASAGAYLRARDLGFDRSIQNMFAADDPVLAPFQRLKRTFGGDEIALAAYVDANLLAPQGIKRLDDLTRQLGKVRGVEGAYSLATSPAFSLTENSLLGKLLAERVREPMLRLSEGYMIGRDRTTAGVICVLAPEDSAATDREATIRELRRALEAHDKSGVLTGEPVMVVDGFGYLEADGELLGATCSTLLMLTIVLCFRSLRWVLIPIAVVYSTLVWTQAALVVAGFRLSMVSSMLWAIVTVIGIATVVHLIISFRENRANGLGPREALLAAGTALGAPIFWSCLTDAAGFGSLIVSDVGPVHDFGTMMMAGSILTLLSIAIVVPGLALAGRFDADPRQAWGEGGLGHALRYVMSWVEHHPWIVAVTTAIGCGTACAGIAWLDVETDFTRNFRENSPIVQSYQFVESRLGGAGAWDVMIPVDDRDLHGFLAKMRELEQDLRTKVVIEGDGQEKEVVIAQDHHGPITKLLDRAQDTQ